MVVVFLPVPEPDSTTYWPLFPLFNSFTWEQFHTQSILHIKYKLKKIPKMFVKIYMLIIIF